MIGVLLRRELGHVLGTGFLQHAEPFLRSLERELSQRAVEHGHGGPDVSDHRNGDLTGVLDLFRIDVDLDELHILVPQLGTRKAPECLVPGHISVRSQELLKAEKRRFYRCSPFAEICPGAFPTYNTAGRREAIVSTCSPLLSRFMIKVSTQSAVNLVGILVAYPGQSPIKLLSPLLFTEQRSRESIISYVS